MAKPSFEELKALIGSFDRELAEQDAMCELLKEEIRELEARMPEWIPVSRQLPDDGSKEVLVTVRRKDGAKYVDTDWCAQGQWLIHNDEEHHKVIAFMPLPKPYEAPDEK